MNDFNQPLISVDSVVFRLRDDSLQVLLVKRWAEPFAGEWALPGVLLGQGESIEDAVQRALKDKADVSDLRGVKQLGVFDRTNRDPRGATISVACYGFIGGETETSGKWFDVKRLHSLPFDHNSIISEALNRCSNPDEQLVRGVLGETFTSGDFMNFVDYAGRGIDRSNITRILPVLYPSIRKIPASSRRTFWTFGGNDE